MFGNKTTPQARGLFLAKLGLKCDVFDSDRKIVREGPFRPFPSAHPVRVCETSCFADFVCWQELRRPAAILAFSFVRPSLATTFWPSGFPAFLPFCPSVLPTFPPILPLPPPISPYGGRFERGSPILRRGHESPGSSRPPNSCLLSIR